MSSNGNGIGNGKAAKKRRRRLILGSIAALILVGGGYGVYAALRPNHEIDPSKLAGVERGDLARVVVATGKIQPLSKIEVKSKASGIVKKLYVDYGNHVKQGDILAELDKVQLEASVRASQANYQAAQAARDSATAALERNKVDAEGPDVPYLKLSMERAQQMFKDGVMSKSLVEDSEKNYQLALNKSARNATWPFRARRSPRPRRRWLRPRQPLKMRKRIYTIPRSSARLTGWCSRATSMSATPSVPSSSSVPKPP